MDTEVRDETGHNSELAQQIEQILREVAPLVEDVTGLSAPACPIFSLVTPEGLQSAASAWADRVAERDLASEGLSEAEQLEICVLVEASKPMIRLMWPLIMGQTVITDEGPVSLLCPDGLQHSGVLSDRRFLTQAVVHELAHQPQLENDADLHWQSFLPGRRTDMAPVFLMEGHARWADEQVTQRLFGTPVDADLAPRSELFTAHANLTTMQMLDGGNQQSCGVGSQFIAHVVNAMDGTDTLNRVWKDLGLVPTLEEFRDPDAWLSRVNAA